MPKVLREHLIDRASGFDSTGIAWTCELCNGKNEDLVRGGAGVYEGNCIFCTCPVTIKVKGD